MNSERRGSYSPSDRSFVPSTIKKAYFHRQIACDGVQTLEGRDFEEIMPQNGARRESKAAITSLMIENFKRKKEGIPLIRLIFCIDADGNKLITTPELITVRGTGRVSCSEMRRMYKHCFGISDEKLKVIAKETIVFVKVKQTEKAEGCFEIYGMEKVLAPWDSPDWEKLWASRIAESRHIEKPDEVNWRKQFSAAIAKA